jgi:hypothetical protein
LSSRAANAADDGADGRNGLHGGEDAFAGGGAVRELLLRALREGIDTGTPIGRAPSPR